MPGTAAERAEYERDVATAHELRLQLLNIIARTQGLRPGQLVRQDINDIVGRRTNKTVFEQYGIPAPGVFKSQADHRKFSRLWSQYQPLIDRIRVLYGILFPDQSLSQFEEIASVLGIVAAGYTAFAIGAAEGAGAGAAAAGSSGGGATAAAGGGAAVTGGSAAAGTGSAAAASGSAAVGASAPTLATVGTGAATASTAASDAAIATQLGTAASASSTASTLASAVGSGLSKLTGSSTVGSIASDVVSGASSLLSEVDKYLGPLFDYAKQVLSDVESIDQKYVIPLADTITKEYDTVSGTISVVKTLAHEGLQGILAIPQTLSSAYQSLASGALRAAEITAQANADIVGTTLVPGMTKGIGEPIANFGSSFDRFSKPALQGVGFLPPIDTNPKFKASDIDSLLSKQSAALTNEGGLVNDFWAGVYDIVRWFLNLAGGFEAALTASKFEGAREARPEALTQGEALEAWKRKILSDSDATTELSFRGYTDERIAALKELMLWRPDMRQAVDMFYRNIISGENMRKILYTHGLNDKDIDALLDVVLEPVNPREAIAANGKKAVADSGWLPQSLGSSIPPEFTAMYTPRSANPNIGVLDWLEHWKLPDIEWWFIAYFRGLATEEDLRNAAKAENWPVEVIDKMLQVRMELIQEWMIPDILSSGVMTDQEASDYMRFAGIEPRSADILLRWAHAKGNVRNVQRAQAIADKFESASKAMYQEGLINKDEYNGLLLEMGFDTEQAALMAALAEHEVDLASKKTFADLLLKQAIVGQITSQQMQSMLLSNGFTEQEAKNYLTKMQLEQANLVKFPSTAEIGDFMKKKLITPQIAYDAYRLQGWSQLWTQCLMQYYGAAPSDIPNFQQVS